MGARFMLPEICPELVAEANRTRVDPYHARDELLRAARDGVGVRSPVIVVGWVFSADFRKTLLVRHPRFGWLSPGGHLEVGESPAEGAAREVREETGVELEAVVPEPLAVLGSPDGQERRYSLAYAFIADPEEPLRPEADRPARWCDLRDLLPSSFFILDHEQIVALADELRPAGAAGA